MLILDTDHLSVLQRPTTPAAVALNERLLTAPDHDIVTTVVSFEEQLRAWLNVIGRYADVSRQVTYYERLAGLAGFFHRWRMLPFDDAAAQEFKRLRHERIRIGTADLKIAAIALTHQGTLLSSNLRDFDQVPGLRVEDWLYG